MVMTQADIVVLAEKHGLSGPNARIAAAIAMAESGGNPNAHNAKPPDDSYGLWQINMIGGLGPARRKQLGLSSNDQLYDPDTNAEAMKLISQDGGNFNPWSTYTNGAYRPWLDNHLIQTDGPGPDSGGGLLGKISNPIDSVKALVDVANKTAAWVSNSENWVRVGYVVGGSVIAIAGLVMIVSSTKTGKAAITTAAGVAKTAATKGAA